MYYLYNLALWLATPLLLPWVAYRAARKGLPGLRQRLGIFSSEAWVPEEPVVWIHAVSVGEVRAAAALIGELKHRIPEARIVITSSTVQGWNAARALLASNELVLFPPADFIFVCRRFLRRIQPNAVVVLETELWPNLFRETRRYGAILLVVNGRISEKTFPRYWASRLLWRRVLKQPDRFFVQSAADDRRFTALGAAPEKVCVSRNLKFDSRPAPSPLVESWREIVTRPELEVGPVIVAGSIMPGEERYVLEAFLQLLPEFPRLWMILAPRRSDGFAAVAERARALGIPIQLRSQWTPQTNLVFPGVMILDSMGELGAIYELATIAYVGGTLVPTGGHNILEPAFFARPIVIGPSMSNFQEIAEEFLQDAGLGRIPVKDGIRIGSIIQIPSDTALAPVWRFLLHNPSFRRRLGEAAHERWRNKGNSVVPVIDELERLLALTFAGLTPSIQQETAGAGRVE